MLSKITCSKGFVYWVDLNLSIIQIICTNISSKNKKYCLIISHPSLSDGDYIYLTDSMGLDDLKSKYSGMIPVDITLDFSKQNNKGDSK